MQDNHNYTRDIRRVVRSELNDQDYAVARRNSPVAHVADKLMAAVIPVNPPRT